MARAVIAFAVTLSVVFSLPALAAGVTLFPARPAAPVSATAPASMSPSAGSKDIQEIHENAEKGDAKSQYDLANSMLVGIGIQKNTAEGIKWLRKSAEQGYAKSQSQLGTLYYAGKVLPKDMTEALKWWNKAAEQRDTNAQDQLGFAYLLGDGVNQDYVMAYMWFNLAASAGDAHAIKDRDSAAKYMTSDQMAAAQRKGLEMEQKMGKAPPPAQIPASAPAR